MAARLEWNGYGKSRVRLVKVVRNGDRHELRDLTVAILLEGDFEAVHHGDNALCLPTDTMKNVVYVLAKELAFDAIEELGVALGDHFLAHHAAVSRVRVEVVENAWSRAVVDGKPHRHTFVPADSAGKRTATVRTDREKHTIESGLDDLMIWKTTGSAFRGFPRDRYTRLKEATERIFATKICATWQYGEGDHASWNEIADRARKALIETFANHAESQSVQHTLYAMGDALLALCPEIASVHLSLPNKHCLLVDLAPFGLTNENEIFVPTDEPHGLIEATLRRGD